jgi:hypothetical protein
MHNTDDALVYIQEACRSLGFEGRKTPYSIDPAMPLIRFQSGTQAFDRLAKILRI